MIALGGGNKFRKWDSIWVLGFTGGCFTVDLPYLSRRYNYLLEDKMGFSIVSICKMALFVLTLMFIGFFLVFSFIILSVVLYGIVIDWVKAISARFVSFYFMTVRKKIPYFSGLSVRPESLS